MPTRGRGGRTSFGESLSVDIVAPFSGWPEYPIVLVVGVHGAEDLPGDAVQHRALRMLARGGLSDGTGVAVIHTACTVPEM